MADSTTKASTHDARIKHKSKLDFTLRFQANALVEPSREPGLVLISALALTNLSVSRQLSAIRRRSRPRETRYLQNMIPMFGLALVHLAQIASPRIGHCTSPNPIILSPWYPVPIP